MKNIIFVMALFILNTLYLNAKEMKKCLIVASYHDAFIGQKLKVDAAKKELLGQCEIKQFNMDTKRNPQVAFIQKKALEAKAIIESWKPDVVIAIEDHASRYLVMEHYKDASIPFVFSGVDWTAEKYGYPYSNATGMIEVSPLRELISQVKLIVPGATKGVFIRPNRLSAEKNYARAKGFFAKENIQMKDGVVNSYEEFQAVFKQAQEDADFVLFTNNVAIENWDDEKAVQYIRKNIKKLAITQSDWMMPFVILGTNKVIEEQGEYAAKVALEILKGAKPEDFPIVANRKWNIYINTQMLKESNITLPDVLLRKAEKFN